MRKKSKIYFDSTGCLAIVISEPYQFTTKVSSIRFRLLNCWLFETQPVTKALEAENYIAAKMS